MPFLTFKGLEHRLLDVAGQLEIFYRYFSFLFRYLERVCAVSVRLAADACFAPAWIKIESENTVVWRTDRLGPVINDDNLCIGGLHQKSKKVSWPLLEVWREEINHVGSIGRIKKSRY